MKTPHKHAELIKAWADGAEIQCKLANGEWFVLTKAEEATVAPAFKPEWEYRIKPETIRYRNYLWQDPWNMELKHVGLAKEERTKNTNNFIKWLGDWQEVEV